MSVSFLTATSATKKQMKSMKKSMKAIALAPALAATAAILGLTACAAATTTCTVRHRYAIVIFQNGFGNNSTTFVTRFRLNVRYGHHNTAHRLIPARISLSAPNGNTPSLAVRTYRVGHARGCTVDKVRTRR